MTTSAVAVVESTALEALPQNVKFSGALWTGYRCLHRVHRLWYWYSRAEIYTNPDNFLKLAAGHAVNWLSGDQLLIRVAAQAVMISTRILSAINEQVALYRESKELWQTMWDPYLLPDKFRWNGGAKSDLLSPSTRYWWHCHYRALLNRVVRIAKALFLVLKRLFTMSMRMLDAIAAFSHNSQNRGEAVNEFFVNCHQSMELLVQNQEVLLSCLENNQRVIGKILKSVHSIFNVEQLISAVKKTLKVTEKANKVSAAIGAVGKDLIKRVAYGCFQTVGMSEYLPATWVPSLRPFDTQNSESISEKERYPPVEWVTFNTPVSSREIEARRVIAEMAVPRGGAKKNIGYRLRCARLLREARQ